MNTMTTHAGSIPSRVTLLTRAGRSVLLGFITRELLSTGELARLIEQDGPCARGTAS